MQNAQIKYIESAASGISFQRPKLPSDRCSFALSLSITLPLPRSLPLPATAMQMYPNSSAFQCNLPLQISDWQLFYGNDIWQQTQLSIADSFMYHSLAVVVIVVAVCCSLVPANCCAPLCLCRCFSLCLCLCRCRCYCPRLYFKLLSLYALRYLYMYS